MVIVAWECEPGINMANSQLIESRIFGIIMLDYYMEARHASHDYTPDDRC